MDDPSSSIELHDKKNHPDDNSESKTNQFKKLKQKLSSPWVVAHVCGGIMLCLPIIVVFSMYQNCPTVEWDNKEVIEYFSMFMFVSLLYFCSFTQLSSLMKTGIALVWCLAFILVLLIELKNKCNGNDDDNVFNDIAVVAILQIVLIAVLNRMHEIGVRANFYGDKEAAEQKNIAVEQKQVADWLIQDMFPTHVSEELKHTKNCSKNYEMVGVLFATIVNFHEFYEENFEGGIECIRILHELVADFDKELTKFKDIEKIKTVYGTTFMAASGLQENKNDKQITKFNESHKYLHLKSLVDFALGLQNTLNEFNKNMLGFRFKLRCGFNAGPVTAGVIGTMKPQYDIWGDTVNLASRMDTLGAPDQIQVDKDAMEKLTDFYTFQLRGTIAVKGKSDRETYFIKARKPEASVMETAKE